MKKKDLSFTLKEIESAHKKLRQADEVARTGERAGAENMYKELIQQFPKYYAAHRALAKLYIQNKQYYPAFQHLALALAGDQGDYFSLLNLEALAYELDMFEAGKGISRLIESAGASYGIKEHSEVHHFNKGKILLANQEYSNAIPEFEKCLRADPQNQGVVLKLVECYLALGRDNEALPLVEKFISSKLEKKNELACVLSNFPHALVQNNIKRCIVLLENTAVQGDEETARLFALARFYHMDKNFPLAWGTISKGNGRVKLSVKDKYLDDKRWEADFLNWARNTKFDKPAVTADEPEAVPLYMLGPSRSGKSCLEKALEWLPGIKLGFENKLLSMATSRAFNVGDRLPATFLPFLPDSLLPDFVTAYRALFREHTNGARLFTTTTPGLITSVPAIMYALPRAKFVFLRRDPLDTALAMYFKHYRNSHYHSCDIHWSLEYIQWYYELVEIWEKKFPDAVLRIEYENLVTRPTDTIKIILAAIDITAEIPDGLEIPNACGFSKPYHAMMKKKGD